MHSHLVRILVQKGSAAKALGVEHQAHMMKLLVSGKGFDASGNLKMVNELQGHLHLNVLRMLREPEVASSFHAIEPCI